MNLKTIVIGFDAKGKAAVLKGAETSTPDQRRYVDGLRNGGEFPKGIERVEVWSRNEGVVKKAWLDAQETREERVAREVSALKMEEILSELVGGTAAVRKNKAKAEAALVAQRLAPKVSAGVAVDATEEEPPVMGG